MQSQPPQDIARLHQLHGLQPVLPVADVAASVAFFSTVLGFDIDSLKGSPPTHARVRSGDGSYGQRMFIHLSLAKVSPVPAIELRIHVGRELDGLHEVYQRRGARVVQEPKTEPWGLREFVVREPNGHLLRFCAEASADEKLRAT